MKNDYLQCSYFKKHCDSPSLYLFSNQMKADVNEFWKDPVQYLIRDKESGETCAEGDDVIAMLKQIGHFR